MFQEKVRFHKSLCPHFFPVIFDREMILDLSFAAHATFKKFIFLTLMKGHGYTHKRNQNRQDFQ